MYFFRPFKNPNKNCTYIKPKKNTRTFQMAFNSFRNLKSVLTFSPRIDWAYPVKIAYLCDYFRPNYQKKCLKKTIQNQKSSLRCTNLSTFFSSSHKLIIHDHYYFWWKFCLRRDLFQISSDGSQRYILIANVNAVA